MTGFFLLKNSIPSQSLVLSRELVTMQILFGYDSIKIL